MLTDAFDLGQPIGNLELVRRGDTDTWQLRTNRGSSFVKAYRQDSAMAFVENAGQQDQLGMAMSFERLALESGIRMPRPVEPRNPLQDWVVRLDDKHFVRVYEWIEPASVRRTYPRERAEWLGTTIARLHRLRPSPECGLPAWWRTAIITPATWAYLIAAGEDRRKPWPASVRRHLPFLLDLSRRIADVCDSAPDSVTTHGDLKPHNVLQTRDGPVLVDWDSVRIDSAALELGRSAYLFGLDTGATDVTRIVLDSYARAGGDIAWPGNDLFLGESRHDLQGLLARMLASLKRIPIERWMGDHSQIDRNIHALVEGLPRKDAGRRELAGQLARSPRRP